MTHLSRGSLAIDGPALPRLLLPGLLGAVLSVGSSSAMVQSTTFGSQKTLSTSAGGAQSVYAIDLDGDGDADVLSASRFDDKIAWYENLGGGSFGAQQVITTSAGGAQSVYAIDLDGDGDADVLSASFNDNKIAWYENLGGGSFGTQQVISTAAITPVFVYATDLDGDGDADVLSASFDDKIAWYENQGGGSFGPQQVITTSADVAESVYATDLDGDGDADVLSASRNDDKIAWYENLGGGSFGPQQVITTSAGGASSVYATDLDGDGDADVLSASIRDDKIAWYENQGGGSFGVQQVITTSAGGASSVYATDLDGDGDADVLSASAFDDKIAWYENLGGGSFGSQRAIATSLSIPYSVYATDLDGDGDADVLSASELDDKIAWYENLGAPNDGCAGALAIGIGETRFQTFNAKDSGIVMACGCQGEETDVWFTYTALGGCSVTLDLAGSDFDTTVAVYSGDCGDLTPIGCDDDGGEGVTSRLSFTGTAGTTYYIQVGGYDFSIGNGVINVTEGVGSIVCAGNANSTGVGAVLRACGSSLVADNAVNLELTDLPLNQTVLFVNSRETILVANPGGSQGDLCIGSLALGRHSNDVLNSGGTGTASLALDLANVPTNLGRTAVVAGETWYWQAWYRDVDGGGAATSNLSSAVGVTFD